MSVVAFKSLPVKSLVVTGVDSSPVPKDVLTGGIDGTFGSWLLDHHVMGLGGHPLYMI